MNVGVPGEGDRTAFWIIIASMFALLGGLVWAFRRRGWL
jgi:Mg2+ and Co2+ transporter CorA